MDSRDGRMPKGHVSVRIRELALLLLAFSLTIAACGAGPVAGERGKDTTVARPDKVSTASDPTSYVVKRRSVNGREVFLIKQQPGSLPAGITDGGRLIMDDKGCLRIKDKGDEGPGYLLVWPPHYSLSAEGGEIRILDGKGRVKARVGDEIKVSGAGLESDKQLNQERDVPEECRRGVHWIVGERVSIRRGD